MFTILGKVLSSLNSVVEGGKNSTRSLVAEVALIRIDGEITMDNFTQSSK